MQPDRRTALFALTATLLGWSGVALADRGQESGRGRGGQGGDEDYEDDDDGRSDHDEVYDARRAGIVMPLREILPIVEAAYPGEIIEVEFDREDGVPVYEFTVLQRNGRYLEIHVDARTGAIIEVEGD